MKKYISKIWGLMLKAYDCLTAKEVELAIGDIILANPYPDFILFLVASRYLDADNYCSGKDASFRYMNGISFKAHGAKHSPEKGIKQFTDLIESFNEKGYDPTSLLVMDRNLNLDNGTHRVALCLLNDIYTVRAKVLRRKALVDRTVDWFYKTDLDSVFLREISDEYKRIYYELIARGHAFICRVEGEVKAVAGDLKNDLSVLSGCSQLAVIIENQDTIEYGFSIVNPRYSISSTVLGGGILLSQRAVEIEKILRIRYQAKNVSLSVSKNCVRK